MITAKVAKDVLFQELEGEAVLLNTRTGIYFGLNSMGMRIWQLLSEHRDVEKIATILLGEYEITGDQLRTDLLDFIEKLASKELVEVHGDKKKR